MADEEIKTGKVFVADKDGTCVLKLVGDIRVVLCVSIETYIESILDRAEGYDSVIVDVMEAQGIDSTSLGVLAKLGLYCREHFSLTPLIFSTNPSITRLLIAVGFEQIFTIQTEFDDSLANVDCEELASSPDDEQSDSEMAVRRCVIDAHKVLMSLSEDNKNAFRELVENLEKGF